MSNVLKQYFVADDKPKKFIINNNRQVEKRLEEHAKELVKHQFAPFDDNEDSYDMSDNDEFVDESGDGFVDGISAEVIEEVDYSAEKERILKEANDEAAQILENAKKEAEALLADANSQASALFDEQKAKGYEDGMSQSQSEILDQKLALDEEYNARKNELEVEHENFSRQLESDLIDAIIQVFNKVFHIQFDEKKDILLHLVKNTISKVEVGKEFRIHVAQANYKFMLLHIDEIRERIGNDVEIEVVNDAALEPSDCRIETSFGVFDCGIDMELNNLINDIRSLCS